MPPYLVIAAAEKKKKILIQEVEPEPEVPVADAAHKMPIEEVAEGGDSASCTCCAAVREQKKLYSCQGCHAAGKAVWYCSESLARPGAVHAQAAARPRPWDRAHCARAGAPKAALTPTARLAPPIS